METEVEGLIRQANDGGDMSNVKSAASGQDLMSQFVIAHHLEVLPACNGFLIIWLHALRAGIEQQINALKAIVGFD